MLQKIHDNKKFQMVMGLVFGFIFGFLLQKGGVTEYNVLIGQLLLTDFTVIKVIFTAVAVGMVGVHILVYFKQAKLQIKTGSVGASLIGGLIFGVGFGLLGYCPGTVSGAAAQGFMDALLGGIPGMLLGPWLFALVYPKIKDNILKKGNFGKLTFYELFKQKPIFTIIIFEIMIISILFGIEFFL